MTESIRPARSNLPPGTPVLGRCVVERLLRRGPLVTVYAARARVGRGLYVLRVVHTDLLSWTEQGSKVFAREIERVKAIKHPTLPRVVAYDCGPDGLRVLSAHTHEQSLRELMARGEGPSPGELCAIVSSVAEALEALHRATGTPIMHRAVYPENIMVGPKNRWIEESGLVHALVMAGMVPDHPANFSPLGYQIPEVFHPATSPRGDVFGLSLLAFEALTSVPAFESIGPSALAALIQVGHLPRVTEFCPELPPSVDQVFEKAWTLSASAYESPGDFASDLSALLASLGLHSRPPRSPSELQHPSSPASRRPSTLSMGSPIPSEAPAPVSIPKAPRLPSDNLNPSDPEYSIPATAHAPTLAENAPTVRADPPSTFPSRREGPPPLPGPTPHSVARPPTEGPKLLLSLPASRPERYSLNAVPQSRRRTLSLPPAASTRSPPKYLGSPRDAVVLGASHALALSTLIAAVIAALGMVQLSLVLSAQRLERAATALDPVAPPSSLASGVPLPDSAPSEAVLREVFDGLRPGVTHCLQGLPPQSLALRVRYDLRTHTLGSVPARGVFSEDPIGGCIQNALRSARAPSSSAGAWEYTLMFTVPSSR